MKLKTIIDEDFVNYKKPSMFIGVPSCTFKCCKEQNIPCTICQNYEWSKNKTLEIDNNKLIQRYLSNPITNCIVIGGLEPFDNFQDILSFIQAFREHCNDTLIVYTGYTEKELQTEIIALKQYPNIIVKFGRFIPNQKKHLDNILGIELISDNQYAKYIS